MSLNLQSSPAAWQRKIKLTGISFLFFLLTGLHSAAQTEPPAEEITLMLMVPRVGNTDMPALVKGETVYLSITSLFDYLKIKNQISSDQDSVTGFFLSPASPFVISKNKNKIFYGERFHSLQPQSLLRTDADLYLRADYFGKIFGLTCDFDFRSLSVTVNTNLELPVIKEMQLASLRKNMTQLRGVRQADTTIGRQFQVLRLGVADWSITSGRFSDGAVNTLVNLSMGALVLGGETEASLTLTPGKPFAERMQMYRWRYVNNDNPVLKQVSVGKIAPESISTLMSAVKGFQLTNAPTTYRKSFGTYTISNTTEPGWMVELYVNNILVNYTKSDASGFYTFEVPLVYGNSNVRLRFYSPWGEEKTKEETIVVPFNFLPADQFEYTLTGGIVKDDTTSKFARLNLKYGLGGFVTVGGGMEYFEAVSSGRQMPYASIALRLFSNVILYSEHTYGVRSKAILNYRHPSNLQVAINYTKYVPGQTATLFVEERKAVFSMPFRGKRLTAFSRLTFSQLEDYKRKTTSAEWLVSAFLSTISGHFSTFALLSKEGNPFIRSNLSLTIRLPQKLRLTQQMQYEYTSNQFSMFRSEAEKGLGKTGYLTVAYERNQLSATSSFSVGLRFNFSGLQAATFALFNKATTQTFQTLRGSVLYDDNNGRFMFNNQTNNGRGGIALEPFLDINCNGLKDAGEQKISGLKVKINGGRLIHNKKDTTIVITGLEAYTNYLLDIDKNSFDNVAWQIKKPLVNVVTDPNYIKTIQVPVSVVGEAEGRVVLTSDEGVKGMGRIIIRVYKNGMPYARLLTDTDGYFNHMGFAPGTYTAEVDKDQVKNVGFDVLPGTLEFTIGTNPEGDFIRDLNFTLKKKNK